MGSREQILAKLRRSRKPFTDVTPPSERHRMVPLEDTDPSALRQRFIAEAEAVGCYVYDRSTQKAAIEKIAELAGDDTQILSWDESHIPIRGFSGKLKSAGLGIADPDNSSLRVGVTGADVALAATGSIVLASGEGKHRTTSLLPDVHVAVIKEDQLIPDLEYWLATCKDDNLQAFKQSSNIVVVTGPSKTADIAQVLIKGAHGPREIHIIILK